MPSYKVLSPGFHDKKLYDPRGKRKILNTEKPFPKVKGKEQVPSWLEPIKTKDAKAVEKQEGSLEQKEELTQEEIDAEEAHVNFIGDGKQTPSNVETL